MTADSCDGADANRCLDYPSGVALLELQCGPGAECGTLTCGGSQGCEGAELACPEGHQAVRNESISLTV